MACVDPDSALTPTTQVVITALKTPGTLVELGQATSLLVYRVRSTISELIEAKLVLEIEAIYQ